MKKYPEITSEKIEQLKQAEAEKYNFDEAGRWIKPRKVATNITPKKKKRKKRKR